MTLLEKSSAPLNFNANPDIYWTEFDDDFEAEIDGEYELEDDEYGEEFAEVEEMIGMRKPRKKAIDGEIIDEDVVIDEDID